MLKIISKTLAVSALMLAGTAAQAAQADGQASANIVKAVTVTASRALDFQTIIVGATGGTVTVSNAATAARTGCVGMTCTGTVTSAQFDVSGSNNRLVNITVPASVSLTNGANSMPATLSSSATSLTLTNGSGTVGGTFYVGGTLTVAGNQVDGLYSGTFPVTVDY